MLKMAGGIIVGFVVWSVLWVGSHSVLAALSPNWFGRINADIAEATALELTYQIDSAILILLLIESIIISLLSGYLTALIAKENTTSTIILGVFLLIVGILIQGSSWRFIPLWYHLSFLILLVPMAVLGGKLKKI